MNIKELTVRLRIEEDNKSFENRVQSGCGLGKCCGVRLEFQILKAN